MKKVGYYNGKPVYEDPNSPPNTMYWLNSEYMDFVSFKPSKIKYLWYRFIKRNNAKAYLFIKHKPYGGK